MEGNLQEVMAAISKEVAFRLTGESVPRIKKCFDELSEDEVWKRPNNNLVSIGNLVLHLCGNVRQYIMFGLGGEPDNRERQSEFDHTDPISREELLNDLDQLMEDVKRVLSELQPDILIKEYKIQGIGLTGFGILMHVVEHFSYHVGQITWHTKLIKDKDLGYYEGYNLDITG